jgi:hypothetical protein
MKVSNWKRLVQSPLPAFILILEFDGDNSPQRAFLVHVGEAHIRRVLHKLRELGTGATEPALHSSTLSVTYGPTEALSTLDGQGLIEGINHYVPDFGEYSREKHRILLAAGYESGGEIVEAVFRLPTIDASANWNEILVDWSLGLTDDIAIEPGAKVFDRRFGIQHPDPIRIITTEGRAVPSSIAGGLVRLRSISGEYQCALEAEVYSTGSVGVYINDSQHKIRLKTRFIDFIMPATNTPEGWQLKIRLPEPLSEIPLKELREFAEFTSLVAESIQDGEVDIEVRVDEHRISGRIEFRSPPPPEMLHIGTAIRSALRIASRLNIPLSLKTTIAELFGQKGELELSDAALRSEAAGLKINFGWPINKQMPATICTLPTLYAIKLGGYLILLVVAYSGEIEATGAIDDGARIYTLSASAVDVPYVQSFKPGSVPELSQYDLLRSVAEELTPREVVRWWEHLPDPGQLR